MRVPLEYTIVNKDETILGIQSKMVAELSQFNGDYSSYARKLEADIEREPDNPVHYTKLSLITQNEGDTPFGVLKRGMERIPEDHLLYHCRAMVQEKRGRRKEAIQDMKRAVELYPVSIETVMSLGTLLNRAGRYEEAIEYWNMLIEMMPEMSVAWNGKAKAEYEMGDIDRAIKHATAAIYCNPQAAAFRSNRGQMLLQVGRYKEGFADFEEAVKLGEKPCNVANRMKNITQKFMQEGKHENLAQIYEKALEIDPDNIDTFIGLSGSYTLTGNVGKIKDLMPKLTRAVKSSTDVSMLDDLGRTLSELNIMDGAIEVAARLYELTGNAQYAALQRQLSLVARNLCESVSTKSEPAKKQEKTGRNEPCSCGSGIKYKKCCGMRD